MTNSFENIEQLNNLSPQEREYAIKILSQLSETGESKIYDELLYSDYKEIPVDIITFIHNPIYLGRALMNEKGKTTVYPYWEKVLLDIFPDPFTVNYTTAIFTGGIGLGKSTIADIGNAYQLYKVLCLKDPYAYYGLQKIDTISIAFLNNTIDNAKDVAWKKFHNMLCMSEWFRNHGKVNYLKKEPEWEPPDGADIELVAGSSANHIIGRAVLGCLDGNTIINTSTGDYKISDLVDKKIIVNCIDNNKNLVNSNECTVKPTKITNEEMQIELEDGTILECTLNHKFLLKDGTYKEAQYLTENDEIFDINI